jgi:hypothetical protein
VFLTLDSGLSLSRVRSTQGRIQDLDRRVTNPVNVRGHRTRAAYGGVFEQEYRRMTPRAVRDVPAVVGPEP